ncbi:MULTISPECIES: TIGR01777 family oxidoreductase [Anaeromyxobacter]|uniref:TIGR01777 family oxidoreductase n=1 Tax=Anaeromyxobacter TaxID=161492 RepID=UPI001F57C94D|nr:MULTISPECIES: TIGR01777 family oxidoreductase [unclassified Anaeromyxobacter]
MHVFVTGATGLIGRALCGALLEAGHAVTALSRSRGADRILPAGTRVLTGDPAEGGGWEEALAACDACVNLAGEPIVEGRWTAAKKRRIRESRVRATERIAAVVRAGGPRVLVSGSAVGWYGSRGDELLDEGSSGGEGFLADVCREWEAAATPAAARARLVLLRTGIVLSPAGGALPKLVRPFRLFAGGPLGRGDFWMPWIHLADEVGIVRFALEDARVEGPLAACAPEPVRNRDLARAIGKVLGRPSFLAAPEVAVRLAVGEAAEAVLGSQRVVPRKALELGYRFRFPTLEAALRELLGS